MILALVLLPNLFSSNQLLNILLLNTLNMHFSYMKQNFMYGRESSNTSSGHKSIGGISINVNVPSLNCVEK